MYELTGKGLRRYPGNYTHYREEKLKQIRLQKKAYERQQEELARLENLVERFKHKPNKAAFARAKRKTMEHMERVENLRRMMLISLQVRLILFCPAASGCSLQST